MNDLGLFSHFKLPTKTENKNINLLVINKNSGSKFLQNPSAHQLIDTQILKNQRLR